MNRIKSLSRRYFFHGSYECGSHSSGTVVWLYAKTAKNGSFPGGPGLSKSTALV